MLTVDLVRAREQRGELLLSRLRGARREQALELGRCLLEITTQSTGQTREDLWGAYAALESSPRDRKLVAGLRKVLEDDCEFEVAATSDPEGLRRDVFRIAADMRRALGVGEPLPRGAVFELAAKAQGITPGEVEASLYADLRGAEQLVRAPSYSAEELLFRYQQAEVQAVLLRATSIVARVRTRSAVDTRNLFAKIKFRRLLHSISRESDGRYRIEIDGPYSLFESVTKYGLGLALVLPVLESSDELELEAQLLWGRERRPLVFRHHTSAASAPDDQALLPTEVQALLSAFARLDTTWRVQPASTILEVPGAGLCVPDLQFVHPELAEPMYLELLGYHSREAVWRRLELVERGLPGRIVFAASSRLRVSAEVLADDGRATLYVFKGTMSARAVEERLEALRARAGSHNR
jgi:predicted nuclease of restriction endonuclease-like RecB superfamily